MTDQVVPLFTNTDQVSRALFAKIDERVAEVADRMARRRAMLVKTATLGIVRLSPDQVDELRKQYAHGLYSYIANAEEDRIAALIDEAVESLK